MPEDAAGRNEGVDQLVQELRKEFEMGFEGFVDRVVRETGEEDFINRDPEDDRHHGCAESVRLKAQADKDRTAIGEVRDAVNKHLATLMAAGKEEAVQAFRAQFAEIARLAERAVDRSVLAGERATVDAKTGLVSGRGMIDRDVEMIIRMRNGDESRAVMEDVVEVMFDMMLFHRGVIELGDGFDDRIKLMASGLIAVARYLADGEGGPYTQMNGDEKEKNESLKLYFPEGSPERKWLDELREMGVKFEPGRLNPGGGDEFVMRIDLNMRNAGDNPDENERRERLEKMIKVMDQVIKNTTFSRDRPVMLGENARVKIDEKEVAAREEAYEAFYNSLNKCVPVAEDGVVTKDQTDFIFRFKNELRRWLIELKKEYFQEGKGLLRDDVDLRMEYAPIGKTAVDMPVIGDVWEYFEQHKPFGEPESAQYHEFLATIKSRLFHEMDTEDLSNLELRSRKTEELVLEAVLEKYQSHLLGEVNGVWKGEKKQKVLTEAAKGMPQSIYTVGTVERSGRNFPDNIGNADKIAMWIEIIRFWADKFTEKSGWKEGDEFLKELVTVNSVTNKKHWEEVMGV